MYRTTAQQLQQQQMSKGEGGGHSQPDLIRQEVQVHPLLLRPFDGQNFKAWTHLQCALNNLIIA